MNDETSGDDSAIQEPMYLLKDKDEANSVSTVNNANHKVHNKPNAIEDTVVISGDMHEESDFFNIGIDMVEVDSESSCGNKY